LEAGLKVNPMKRIVSASVAGLTLAGVTVLVGLSPRHSHGDGVAISEGKLPDGYRDWGLISVAHEEGHLNDLRAVLGNDVAIKAYREEKLPFPDGTIIARLAWRYLPSEENNRVFGRPQSFVAGPPVNGVQFMVKDSRKYAASGGWGFFQFNDGKPVDEAAPGACFACHEPVKARDFIFTRYAPRSSCATVTISTPSSFLQFARRGANRRPPRPALSPPRRLTRR
jgi:hypothetical protein